MGLAPRIRQLEKTVMAMTESNREQDYVVVLRKYPQIPGEMMAGYKDDSGTLWPMDRTQWPSGQRPQGTLEEVWHTHGKKKLLTSAGETPDPLHDYVTINYFTLTREEYDAIHGQDAAALPT